MAAPGVVVAPSAYDALTAMVIEDAGFDAVHVSGSGLARSFGLSDFGLVTATEMVAVHARIVDATSIPIIGDAETGFGNAANTIRSVKAYERSGVAAIHLEDDFTPKSAGGDRSTPHGAIPIPEMVGKLRAALDARSDPSFVIIARSGARDGESLEAVVERLHAYEETGVDALWPGVSEPDEMRALAGRFRVPLVGVPPRPRVTAYEYGDYGHKVACLPSILGSAAVAAMREALAAVRQTGDTATFMSSLPGAEDARRWYSGIGRAQIERVAREFSGHG
jgi:2-methylisocitrate lyase-like PEP mutase family enzyme